MSSTSTFAADEYRTGKTVLESVATRMLDTYRIRKLNTVLGGGYGERFDHADMRIQDWVQLMVHSDGEIALQFEDTPDEWRAYLTPDDRFHAVTHQKYGLFGGSGYVDWFDIDRWMRMAELVKPVLCEEDPICE